MSKFPVTQRAFCRLRMLWQMACTGRKWCDFVSYDPRMPDNLQIFIKRFERDEDRIAEMEREVVMFLADLQKQIDTLLERYPMAA